MNRTTVTPSSGNVFADLGLDEAPLLLAKADLAIALTRRIRELGLTETEVCARLGLEQAQVSAIARGRLDGFSEDDLRACLERLAQGNTGL